MRYDTDESKRWKFSTELSRLAPRFKSLTFYDRPLFLSLFFLPPPLPLPPRIISTREPQRKFASALLHRLILFSRWFHAWTRGNFKCEDRFLLLLLGNIFIINTIERMLFFDQSVHEKFWNSMRSSKCIYFSLFFPFYLLNFFARKRESIVHFWRKIIESYPREKPFEKHSSSLRLIGYRQGRYWKAAWLKIDIKRR